jgi:hypothetical protein
MAHVNDVVEVTMISMSSHPPDDPEEMPESVQLPAKVEPASFGFVIVPLGFIVQVPSLAPATEDALLRRTRAIPKAAIHAAMFLRSVVSAAENE